MLGTRPNMTEKKRQRLNGKDLAFNEKKGRRSAPRPDKAGGGLWLLQAASFDR